MTEVMSEEVWAVGVVAVAGVDLSEAVMHRGVEGAGDDQGTQRRDWLRQLQVTSRSVGATEVGRFEGVVEVDGVPELAVIPGQRRDAAREVLHGPERV